MFNSHGNVHLLLNAIKLSISSFGAPDHCAAQLIFLLRWIVCDFTIECDLAVDNIPYATGAQRLTT